MAGLPKRYNPKTEEPRLQAFWQAQGVYHFDVDDDARPVYSIDTPPPTVSGHLHLGHVYSYSHPDFVARFWRMNGYNVFYPMGYDDNGLPTERLVEQQEGIRAVDVGREAFIERCLAVSEQAERDYQALWQRLGLSIDWRYTYRTIDAESRRISQLSFLDLYRKGLAYRKEAPAIWCPECQTAIAQAELNDLDRASTFYTLAFALEDGGMLEIATTRPELLSACVAIFVHPDDARYAPLVGKQARVPYFDQWVPILTDPGADPETGTGAVMCCTFGDTADVAWWYTHNLPLRVALDRAGRMTGLAGAFAELPSREARRQIVAALAERGLLLDERPTAQSVRVHERCDTPVEYIVTPQWFVRVLDFKDELLESGANVHWHPDHMETRFREWVENLNWDWCISRQRYYGVTFPVWYCDACGAVILAGDDELPVDPTTRAPSHSCQCGGTSFTPETDVMDTWATSSLSPQIVGQWLANPALYAKVYPFSLRSQAHEIIRTWAFYTIVKSYHHFGATPWTDAAISGWGLAPEGTGKISKSRGGGPMPPMEMLEQYSADAVRYWTSSTGFGKDSIISEEKIQIGAKLVTKLWNVARFAERFIANGRGEALPERSSDIPESFESHDAVSSGNVVSNALPLQTPADRWILARLQTLIRRVTDLFQGYDYAAAKSEIETFFWRDLADNYLEMAKLRLYNEDAARGDTGVSFTLAYVLLATLKLFAPFLPHVTEEIYQHLFAEREGAVSIHLARWPEVDARFADADAETFGETLVEIATAVRRHKSEQGLSLGAEIGLLSIATRDTALMERCRAATQDLISVTRAQRVEVVSALDGDSHLLLDGEVQVGLVELL
ncbi:MAG: valine--tRNA ligase [Anaerolineae bacterium]